MCDLVNLKYYGEQQTIEMVSVWDNVPRPSQGCPVIIQNSLRPLHIKFPLPGITLPPSPILHLANSYLYLSILL